MDGIFPSDKNLQTSDVTTNNASTTKHGFLKKLSNTATEFMNGAGNWAVPAGGGKILQLVTKTFGSQYSTTSTTIPYDGSIPQSGEGAAFDSMAVTPLNASSTLLFTLLGFVSGSTLIDIFHTFFKDADANATYARTTTIPTTDYSVPLVCAFTVTAGSTSAQTWAIRWGTSGGTAFMNRTNGQADLFSTVLTSVFTCVEIAP